MIRLAGSRKSEDHWKAVDEAIAAMASLLRFSVRVHLRQKYTRLALRSTPTIAAQMSYPTALNAIESLLNKDRNAAIPSSMQDLSFRPENNASQCIVTILLISCTQPSLHEHGHLAENFHSDSQSQLSPLVDEETDRHHRHYLHIPDRQPNPKPFEPFLFPDLSGYLRHSQPVPVTHRTTYLYSSPYDFERVGRALRDQACKTAGEEFGPVFQGSRSVRSREIRIGKGSRGR